MKLSDLDIPNVVILTEKEASIGDTIATKAKSIGSRFLNRNLHTLGSLVGGGHEAFGRLRTRRWADEIMKDWLRFKGATGTPQTRGNVYRFLARSFSGNVDDTVLRSITGMPLKQQAQPGAGSQQQTQAEPLATSKPNPEQQSPQQQQPNTASPDGAAQANPPAAGETQPSQGGGKPYTKQVAAQLKGVFDHILDMYHPRGSARKIRPPPNLHRESWEPRVRLAEAQETLAQLLNTMLAIGRNGDDETRGAVINMIADLKRRSITRELPEIEALPRGEEMFDPNYVVGAAQPEPQQQPEPQPSAAGQQQQAQPAPQQPAQQPAQQPSQGSTQPPAAEATPTPAQATPAAQPAAAPTTSGVPIMITGQMKQQLDALGYAPEDVQEMTPEQAHQVIAANTRKPVNIQGELRKFYASMQQPQVNSNQVLASLAQLVKQAKGTPQENTVKQMITTLQQDPAMKAKVPQLAQISTESRRATPGALLREAGDNEPAGEDVSQEDLSRSETDKMFMQTAQHIADADIDGSTTQPDAMGASDVGGEGNAKSIDHAYDAARDERIFPEKLKKLIAKTPRMTADDQFAVNKVLDMVNKSSNGRYTVAQLQRDIYHAHDKRLERMSNNVKSMIIKATTR